MDEVQQIMQRHHQQIQQLLTSTLTVPTQAHHNEIVKVIDEYNNKYHRCKKCNLELHYSFFTMQRVVRKDKDDKSRNVIKLIPYGYCKSCASQYHKERRRRLKASSGNGSHPLYLLYNGSSESTWEPLNK